MSELNLKKLFVLVPSTLTTVTLDAVKTKSQEPANSDKLYFVEKYNQIVKKGVTYGIDPKTFNEIQTLLPALGATTAEDGTVSFDIKGLNYKGEASTILGVITNLDAKIKSELDKLAASKTLDADYEFKGKFKYVASVTGGAAAHLALVDKDGTELSSVLVSDIIGNGVLESSAYDKETGILTLNFKTAAGSTNPVEVNLAAMLDINDVLIADGSKKYLDVDLTGSENSQAVFSVKTVKVKDATDVSTGLADAKDVQDYVKSQTTDLAVTAAGDAYVSATVNADTDKKHVIVSTNVKDVTATAGTRGEWSVSATGVASIAGEVAPTISGVANSLVDGAKAAEAVKTYVDAKVAAEAAERAAKIEAAVKALDKATETVGDTNVHVAYKEEDGIVTIESVTEDYATVNRTPTTSTAGTPATNAAITVTDGTKLVKGADLEKVAEYVADKVAEEQHRVDNKIAETTTGLNVKETTVSETVAGEGAVSFKYSETNGIVSISDLSVTYATKTGTGNDAKLTSGIVDASTLNAALSDLWETYTA